MNFFRTTDTTDTRKRQRYGNQPLSELEIGKQLLSRDFRLSLAQRPEKPLVKTMIFFLYIRAVFSPFMPSAT